MYMLNGELYAQNVQKLVYLQIHFVSPCQEWKKQKLPMFPMLLYLDNLALMCGTHVLLIIPVT